MIPRLPFRALGVLAAAAAALAATRPALAQNVPDETPARIEVAFVLDTTGSMSGLIEGAKRKIWSIASNMMDLKPQPEIRFALIGYRDRGDAYVTKAFDLTEDVQSIYGELLAFKAKGGGDLPESVNQALEEAVNDLSWSPEDKVFRTIFLVGDAPPHMDYQDDTPFPRTLERAAARDIVVNAVQAGGATETARIWREIAQRGGGAYAQIAQDGAMVSIDSPFDAEIERLNVELNETVVPYGRAEARDRTREKLRRSNAADGAAAAEMNAYFSKKSVASARQVITGGGDLVEDLENGVVALESVDEAALPEALKPLSPEERAAYVAGRAAERASLRAKLDKLLDKRTAYVAERKAALAARPDAFDAEVDRLIKEQAARKGFR